MSLKICRCIGCRWWTSFRAEHISPSAFLSARPQNEILEFAKWRIEHKGKLPKASTLSNHNATKAQIPDLENKGVKSERRSAFSLDEFRQMSRALNHPRSVSCTGMRHGTGTENLCWKHINVIEEDGAKYLTFNVDGKTGRRELLAKPNCLVYLIRIRQRFLS